jgi:hypothetical protein
MLLFFYFDKKWLGWKLFFNAEKPRPFCFLALVPIDRRALLLLLPMCFKYFMGLKVLTFSIYVVWIISEGRSE